MMIELSHGAPDNKCRTTQEPKLWAMKTIGKRRRSLAVDSVDEMLLSVSIALEFRVLYSTQAFSLTAVNSSTSLSDKLRINAPFSKNSDPSKWQVQSNASLAVVEFSKSWSCRVRAFWLWTESSLLAQNGTTTATLFEKSVFHFNPLLDHRGLAVYMYFASL
jgi:hypothetical protein